LRLVAVFFVLLLAACAAGPPRAPTATALVAPDGRAIELRATGPQPMTAARLVLPGAAPLAASEIRVLPPLADRAGIGIGAAGGSSSGLDTGVSISVPLGWLARTQPTLESRARIVLPDPDSYRQGAPSGRLELEFGSGAEMQRLELPAPAR
jgi:hypothetical protein